MADCQEHPVWMYFVQLGFWIPSQNKAITPKPPYLNLQLMFSLFLLKNFLQLFFHYSFILRDVRSGQKRNIKM